MSDLTFSLLNVIITSVMWEFVKQASQAVKSSRRIADYFLAALVVAFLCVVFTPLKTFAADASWESQNSINYDGGIYNGPSENVKELGLADGSQAYTYLGPIKDTNKRSQENGSPTVTGGQNTLYVIFFAKGIDLSSATTAKYKTLTYNGPGSYSNPSTPIDITISKTPAASNTGNSSCTITGGLGWIICPVTNFLASGMDYAFGALTGFLNVRPVTTDTDSALFRAWTYMRSFANVAFVIAFLIIIYSQLTSFGISNYGIKKLLPRLIIAALLVNLSYYICAIAVDISNILGHSLQGVFLDIRNHLVGTQGNNWNLLSVSSIAGFVLSGGTAAIAGATGLVIAVSTYGVAGSIFLLLPTLMGGLFAILLALLIMGARQALITILIIISPLAFVAYLLPNTEKWFEKWQSTFMTMLIVFPAFSVVYGGSQLAAAAIIQNADSINVVILGMIVQVTPLMITPLLIKLSGSMLGKLANFVQNPSRYVMDKTRDFTKDRSQNIAAHRLGAQARPGVLGWAQRNSQRRDHNRRRREGWRNTYNSMADARWAGSRDFSNIDQLSRETAERKGLGEARSEYRYNASKNIPGRLQTLDTQMRSVADQNAAAKATTEAEYEVRRTRAYQNANNQEWTNQSPEMQRALVNARVSAQDVAIQGMRKQTAQRVQQTELAAALDNSLDLQKVAGGHNAINTPAEYTIDTHGAVRAQAAAINVTAKAAAENTANINAILDRSNLTDAKMLQLAIGQAVQDDENRTIQPDADIVNTVINRLAASSGADTLQKLIEELDLSANGDRDIRLSFTEGLKKNSYKPKFLGMGWIAQVTQGATNAQGVPLASGESVLDQAIINAVNGGKLDTETLINQDKDALKRILATIERARQGLLDPTLVDSNGTPLGFNPEALTQLEASIAQTQGMFYSGRGGEVKPTLNAIHDELVNNNGIPPTQPPQNPFNPGGNPNP